MSHNQKQTDAVYECDTNANAILVKFLSFNFHLFYYFYFLKNLSFQFKKSTQHFAVFKKQAQFLVICE